MFNVDWWYRLVRIGLIRFKLWGGLVEVRVNMQPTDLWLDKRAKWRNQFSPDQFIRISGGSNRWFVINATVRRRLHSSTKDARTENKRSVKVCLRSLSSLEGLIVEKNRIVPWQSVAIRTAEMSFIKKLTTTLLNNYQLQFAALVLVLLT